jgi:hypothetical protein
MGREADDLQRQPETLKGSVCEPSTRNVATAAEPLIQFVQMRSADTDTDVDEATGHQK